MKLAVDFGKDQCSFSRFPTLPSFALFERLDARYFSEKDFPVWQSQPSPSFFLTSHESETITRLPVNEGSNIAFGLPSLLVDSCGPVGVSFKTHTDAFQRRPVSALAWEFSWWDADRATRAHTGVASYRSSGSLVGSPHLDFNLINSDSAHIHINYHFWNSVECCAHADWGNAKFGLVDRYRRDFLSTKPSDKVYDRVKCRTLTLPAEEARFSPAPRAFTMICDVTSSTHLSLSFYAPGYLFSTFKSRFSDEGSENGDAYIISPFISTNCGLARVQSRFLGLLEAEANYVEGRVISSRIGLLPIPEQSKKELRILWRRLFTGDV